MTPRARAAGWGIVVCLQGGCVAPAPTAQAPAAATRGVAAAVQDTRRSSFDDMSLETRAMQRDDTQNPAMLWVAEGEALWTRPPAGAGQACSACHGDASRTMRGVAAGYPALDSQVQSLVNLQQRINLCRERHQRLPALPPESRELLSLEAYVALQSRGMPIAPRFDARLQPHRARGEALYRQRMGQLDLSCAQCHDQYAGRRLAGNVIPQAHPTGYPIYRLEWQELGSLQRRLRNCMTGVRAQPYAYGAQELVELELYLAERARGMALEAPAIRP